MELTDRAFILKADPFREQDALVTVFGREQGLLRGVARFGMTSKHRGTYCIGNWVDVTWHARLEEHLGNITCELVMPSGTMIMRERQRCYALQSMCALVQLSFQQRDPHPALSQALELLVESMRFNLHWAADYARFEAILLRETGFGLGLERCIVTGSGQELDYVSPKSGCAVSREVGAEYHDKLFAYPTLLMQEMHQPASAQATTSALELTGHFLQKWLFATLEKTLPASRERLIQTLEKTALETI